MANQTKIYGFYHLCTIGKWKEIFDNQISTIQQSSLYDVTIKIFVSVVGPERDSVVFPDKFEIIFKSDIMNNYERNILQHMHQFCKENDDIKVWYIHSKGVRHSHKPLINVHGSWNNIMAWRKYMEYFMITKYEKCLESLETSDTCGVNLHTYPYTHYSGNFWWANGNYVRTLNKEICNDYLAPEMWICSGTNSKNHCVHESNVDHYWVLYDEKNYVKEISQ
jgi:hypothetical protein